MGSPLNSVLFVFRLVMNSKLFVAMGINWGLEFLSSIAQQVEFIPREIWYVFDMVNACQ